MSSITLNGINGCTSASATYLQANPATSVAMSTNTQQGATFASNPWISPASAGLKLSSIAATINNTGAIVVSSACKISIAWSALVASSSAAQQTQFFILPTVSSSTLTGTQINGKAFPVACTVFTMASGGSANGLSVCGTFLAKAGDIFVIATGDSNVNMRNGQLQIITEPLIGA